MASELRFEDRVAVVTGAGNGLGRAHAQLLAARGARVVVNDLGGAMTGGGKSSAAADAVVAEIKEAGGEAIANYDSVEDGARIVEAAMDAFGRIDVVVNNAGILRDVSFHKMTAEDWDLVYRVHVLGAFRVTHAAWPHLRAQQYGRVVMTASAAGIYGNFGQANYAMAKLGLHGFAQTLALEGVGKNVYVNTVAPIAGSRLTETVLPQELVDALKPEYVSPLVAWLCHEDCDETGGLFEVGGGYFGKLRWGRAAGQTFRLGRDISPEDVRRTWSVVTGFEDETHPATVAESLSPILDNINAGPSRGGNEFIDVDAALAYRFPKRTTRYDARDLSLYALGVGAAEDPTDDAELRQVFEMHQEGLAPLPTFGIIPAINNFLSLAKEGALPDGFHFGLERILHGEQRMTLARPLPLEAELTHEMRVVDVLDKGKHAFVDIEAKSFDADGELVVTNNIMIVARGCGGFGGARGGGATGPAAPDREPDAVRTQTVTANQALLYRLSGDWNPLHADPGFASAMGFDKPILHGLCTLGYAARHVVDAFAPDRDPKWVHSVHARMSASVFPGETLETRMWKDGQTVIFETRVKERGEAALTRASVTLWDEIPKPAAKAPQAPEAAAPAASAEPNSRDVFAGITQHVAAHAADLANIATVYQFQLTAPDSTWTLDLKSSPPVVAEGAAGKADCTLTLTDADFMDMCTGKADPQQLFMKGQLKISGNLMASQKLTFLQKLDPQLVIDAAKARAGGGGDEAPVAAPPAPAAPAREAAAARIFEALSKRLTDNPALAEELRANLGFSVTDPDSHWTLTTRGGAGVQAGPAGEVDATFTLADADLEALARGEATPQQLYQRGQLRIDGDVAPAHRLALFSNLI